MGADDLVKQLDRVADAQPPIPSTSEGLLELRQWMAQEVHPVQDVRSVQERRQQWASTSPVDAVATKAVSALGGGDRPSARGVGVGVAVPSPTTGGNR
ncbi:hypothetical protein, partial [Streptomyces atriruber]|uniref:hypothetical protein n=1 Tax=Streptomyces atriruber TaxID=545121 RepID=UPI0006E1B074